MATSLGLRRENLLEVRQTVVFETSTHDGGRRLRASGVRLGKTEIDQAIRGEVRMHGDVQQPSLPLSEYLGNSLYRLRQQFPLANDPEPSGPFRYQNVATGKERHRPGIH